MKRILFVLLLSACGGAKDDNNGYGYHYDVIDEDTGLRVRYSDKATPIYPLEVINQWYIDVMGCTGLSKEGPLLIFTTNPPSESKGGLAFFNGTILVWGNKEAIDFLAYGEIVKHEFVHQLLFTIGIYNHDSPLFSRCAFHPEYFV